MNLLEHSSVHQESELLESILRCINNQKVKVALKPDAHASLLSIVRRVPKVKRDEERCELIHFEKGDFLNDYWIQMLEMNWTQPECFLANLKAGKFNQKSAEHLLSVLQDIEATNEFSLH